MAFIAIFEEAYATPPGSWPRSRPAMEEILMIEPPVLASRMRWHTNFDTSHGPVKFVLIVLFHSSSGKSMGELMIPTEQTKKSSRWNQFNTKSTRILPRFPGLCQYVKANQTVELPDSRRFIQPTLVSICNNLSSTKNQQFAPKDQALILWSVQP